MTETMNPVSQMAVLTGFSHFSVFVFNHAWSFMLAFNAELY